MARVREVSVQDQVNPEPIIEQTIRQSAGGPIVHWQDPPKEPPKKKGITVNRGK